MVENLIIFIEFEKPSGTYNNIYLKEIKKGLDNSSRIIYAKKGYLNNSNEKKYLELFNGDIVNINGSKTNNFSFDKINFDLSEYTSKSITFPKIQELNSKLLIKCLAYDDKGKAKDLKSEIFTCGNSTIKNVKEEVLKQKVLD